MKMTFTAALLASTIAGVGFASAMTASPATPVTGADIIKVAGGCGPGFHPGPYGRRCFPNREVVVVPPAVVVGGPVVRRCRIFGPNRVCRTFY